MRANCILLTARLYLLNVGFQSQSLLCLKVIFLKLTHQAILVITNFADIKKNDEDELTVIKGWHC